MAESAFGIAAGGEPAANVGGGGDAALLDCRRGGGAGDAAFVAVAVPVLINIPVSRPALNWPGDANSEYRAIRSL
jgi:hypothetical protein